VRIRVEPSKEYNTPYDTSDELAPSYFEELAVAGNTAELQKALGADFDVMSADDKRQQAELLRQSVKNQDSRPLQSFPVAYAAASFLREYGSRLALDVTATRSAITNKLMELANCGDPKYELRALELLGKHSDIGLFTERSEITINYKDPEALENAIKERVKRLLNADLVDVTPVYATIDDELGFFGVQDPPKKIDKSTVPLLRAFEAEQERLLWEELDT
jgi:hypothetical protein